MTFLKKYTRLPSGGFPVVALNTDCLQTTQSLLQQMLIPMYQLTAFISFQDYQHKYQIVTWIEIRCSIFLHLCSFRLIGPNWQFHLMTGQILTSLIFGVFRSPDMMSNMCVYNYVLRTICQIAPLINWATWLPI